MIKIAKIKPFSVYRSNSKDFLRPIPNNVSLVQKNILKYIGKVDERVVTTSRAFETFSSTTDKSYVYVYQIEKFKTKKTWKGKKRTGDQGKKVKKYSLVHESHVVLKIFRFPANLVTKVVQHSRHFEIELKIK